MSEFARCCTILSFLVSGSMTMRFAGTSMVACAINVFTKEGSYQREVMINLSAGERDAIEGMDVEALRSAVEEARETRSSTAVTHLQLYRLGTYVQSAERRFALALANLRKAKAAANIARTEQAAIRAGWDLVSAVDQMKDRARQEKQDGECFYVDDHIHEPFIFRPDITVSVSYRWRATKNGDWSHGRITFHHRHVARRQSGAFWGSAQAHCASARERTIGDAPAGVVSCARSCPFQRERFFSRWWRRGGYPGDVPCCH